MLYVVFCPSQEPILILIFERLMTMVMMQETRAKTVSI